MKQVLYNSITRGIQKVKRNEMQERAKGESVERKGTGMREKKGKEGRKRKEKEMNDNYVYVCQ